MPVDILQVRESLRLHVVSLLADWNAVVYDVELEGDHVVEVDGVGFLAFILYVDIDLELDLWQQGAVVLGSLEHLDVIVAGQELVESFWVGDDLSEGHALLGLALELADDGLVHAWELVQRTHVAVHALVVLLSEIEDVHERVVGQWLHLRVELVLLDGQPETEITDRLS